MCTSMYMYVPNGYVYFKSVRTVLIHVTIGLCLKFSVYPPPSLQMDRGVC